MLKYSHVVLCTVYFKLLRFLAILKRCKDDKTLMKNEFMYLNQQLC